MPSLHFTSPYGHVKPPLLQALSFKRKKTSHVAATAAAVVLKAFTSSRGKNALLRQGVKYRNMFHSGGGLVRERQPGEEVTPEKHWVTDEESEYSESEESEEVMLVRAGAEEVVETFEVEESETMEEVEVLDVPVEEHSAMDLMHAEEEIAKTDLLKLELSLAEKEIPQVPVQAKEEIVVLPEVVVQEITPEISIIEIVEQVAPAETQVEEKVEEKTPEPFTQDVTEQALEQLIVSVEQVKEQESVVEPVAILEEKPADVVLTIPEPEAELILELSNPALQSLTSVMNILEPLQREPLTLTAVMDVLESSKPEPIAFTAVMEVVELSVPEPFVPMTVPEVMQVQQPEPIPEVNEEAEATPLEEIQEVSVVMRELQEEVPEETQEVQEEIRAMEEEMTTDTAQRKEVEIQDSAVVMDQAELNFLEDSSLEEAAIVSFSNDIIEGDPEVEQLASEVEPVLLPSVPELTPEVPSEKLEKTVEKVLPICVQVIPPQPPQETPVLAISEKHSEQLFDDEVCDYEETEPNEDEEPEAEVQPENQELEGLLEATPSHMFKLTLPVPSSNSSPSPSTVALCVKPEQTLLDLQKLIQLELPYTSTGSHISFTTLGIEPPDCITETSFAIKDGEITIRRRKSPYSDPDKYGLKSTCIPTRWSLSTEIGAFIGDAAKSQCFTIEVSRTPDKPPSTTIRISLPTFNDRTLELRTQLRTLAPNLSALSALKSECDAAVQRAAQKRSILTLAMNGFACLLLPLLFITFAYLSQPALLSSSPPRDLKVSHPVTTYIAAGLADILLLAGFAYLWSVYRTTGRHSTPDLATVKKVYGERGFDVAKWEELQTETRRLRCEIRRVAAEYGVCWDDNEGAETKETNAAATAA